MLLRRTSFSVVKIDMVEAILKPLDCLEHIQAPPKVVHCVE